MGDTATEDVKRAWVRIATSVPSVALLSGRGVPMCHLAQALTDQPALRRILTAWGVSPTIGTRARS